MSANMARRQMTKGAMAMVAATVYPVSEGVGGHKKKSVAATAFQWSIIAAYRKPALSSPMHHDRAPR